MHPAAQRQTAPPSTIAPSRDEYDRLAPETEVGPVGAAPTGAKSPSGGLCARSVFGKTEIQSKAGVDGEHRAESQRDPSVVAVAEAEPRSAAGPSTIEGSLQ